MNTVRLIAAAWMSTAILAHDAGAFGTKVSHQGLADASVTRADSKKRVTDYLRDDLGLRRGIDEPLAIQFGLDPEIDDDLIVADDPTTSEIETRLNRSLSRFDEDENGNRADRPLAPKEVQVFFQKNCRAALDFDTCFAALTRADVRQLIRIGTYAEDNPNPRSQHHFHDPERSHGIVGHGLDNSSVFADSLSAALLGTAILEGGTIARGGSWLRAIAGILLVPLRPFFEDLGNFDLRGRSAVDRAVNASLLGPASAAHPDNRFALPDAERYLFRALTAPRADEREHFLALHFLAVGHVLHLLQDMGSVAHVRNDFIRDHVVVDKVLRETSLEEAGDRRAVFDSVLAAIQQPDPLVSSPFLHLLEYGSGSAPISFFETAQAPLDPAGFDVVDFWDRGSFDDPDDLDPARAGLAERVHNRFFSAGSVSNAALTNGYDRPLVTRCAEVGSSVGASRDAVLVTELRARSLPTGAPLRPGPEDTYRFASSPLVPHLARCRYHGAFESAIGAVPRDWELTVIDESVQRDYLELLFPLVIDYGARFLEHYLAQRLEVVPVGRGEFRLRNRTELLLRADARAVEIAYTAVDPQRPEGIRVRVPADCGSGEFELLPGPAAGEAGPLSDFLCRLPESLPVPALDRADFFVLVRGALGARGTVAGPDDFDALIDRKDFVLAFDRVQPQILVHRATIEIPDAPNEDQRFPIDIVSLPFEPSRPLEPGESERAGANVTAALRAAIGTASLDLTSPAGEPGGARLLLRSDLDATTANNFHQDVAAPQRLYFFDPALDPTGPDALVPLPFSELAVPRNRLREAGVWSSDGEAVFYFEDETSSLRNRLRRFTLATGEAELFQTDEAFTASGDPAVSVNDLPIGTERQVCRGIDHLATRSATSLAVTTGCLRETVEFVFGVGNERRWAPRAEGAHTEIRVATVEPSASEPGTLEARFTARFDIGAAQVLECGLSQTCWQPSSEPNGGSGSSYANPAWSPDGSKVAFLRDPEGSAGGDFRQEIWVADLATQQLHLALTRDHGDLFDLQWSPDARWLVFGIAEDPFDIFAIPADADGTELPQRLTRGLRPFSFSIHGPLLLPDGT